MARDNASKAFRDVGNSAEQAGKKGNQAGSLIGSGMKLAAGALLGGGLIAGFKALYDQAAESARIGRLTNQVLQSTGGVAGVTAKQVSSLATAISQKTGVDDEAIQSGENLLLTFTNIRNEAGKGNDVFNQATSIITDMSVALGQDMKSSAIQVGKALNDPIKGVTALQRVGVSFTASQKEQIKTLVETGHTLDAQRIILKELGTEFGGAAAAAATPFDKLKVTLGNLAEEAGGHLIPIVDGLANFFMDDLLPAVGNLEPVFDAFGGVLKFVAEAGGAVLGFFNDLPGPIKAGAIALGAFVLLRGPLTSLFSSVAEGATNMALRLASSVGSVGVLRTAAGGLLGVFGGPWGLAIAGATAGLGLLVQWLGSSDDATKETTQATRDYADALREANGVITDNVRQSAAKAAQDVGLLDVADKVGVSLSTVTDAITHQGESLDATRARLQTFIDAHTTAQGRAAQFGGALDSEGKAAQAALTALNDLARQGGVTATSQDQLARATAQGGTAAGEAALSQQQLETQLEETGNAASDAKRQTDLYKTSLDILTGNNVSLIQVESQLQDALAAAKDAMKNMTGEVLQANGELNLQSEAGRKAADVLLGVRDSGNQLIATMIQQGATSAEVRAKDAQLRAGFISTAMQMGISRQAAEALANQILGIPAERKTTITADTGPARGQIQGLINDYRGYQINLGIAGGTGTFAAAEGGILPGYTPGRDVHHFQSATAGGLSLSGGESIMRPEWTRAVGSSFVGRMNKLAKTSGVAGVRSAMGFAGGGVVPADWLGGMVFKAGIDPGALAATRKALLEPAAGAVAALRWARSQVGKPYIWGGVGPAGYDCSGFMSAITNVIHGRSPFSRLGSTASFPWGGFGPGLFGPFRIGSTKNAFGTGIGHMAGTLLGVNVESTGSVGVRVGGAALGATNGLFGTRASLRFGNGGVIGEPVAGVGMRSGASYTFGESGPETVTPGVGGGNITVIAQFGSETIRAQSVRVVKENERRQKMDRRSGWS